MSKTYLAAAANRWPARWRCSALRPHHAYCFANRRANRMKGLALDGEQWQALVPGLPWQHVGAAGAISVL